MTALVQECGPGTLCLEIGGESLVMLPHRAVYWPQRRTLLVADMHLDKCEAMRVSGIPMPRAVYDELVARLQAAVLATGALRVMVLGDMLHAPAGLTGPMVECFGAWRASTLVELVLVPGNHDRGLEKVRDAWRLTVLDPIHFEGPFAFTHVPREVPGRYTWSGHVHPAVTLRSAVESLKLPCFHVGPKVGVLPAFSSFTAGGPRGRGRSDRVFGVVGGRVVEV